MRQIARDPIINSTGADDCSIRPVAKLTCNDRRLSPVGFLAVRSSLISHVLFTFTRERPSVEFVRVGGIVAPARILVMSMAATSLQLVVETARSGLVQVSYQ